MLSDPLSPTACPSIMTFLAHSNKDILSGLKDGNLLMCGGRVDLLSTPDGVGLGGQVRGVVRRQRWEGRWKGSELHRRVPRSQGDGGAVTRWLLCSEAKEHAAEWVGQMLDALPSEPAMESRATNAAMAASLGGSRC